jgi:uncharacterized protein (TIGR02117 family)
VTAPPAHLLGRADRAVRAILRATFSCAALGCLVTACASNPSCYETGTPAAELRTIFIVQRGWHTGVLIPAADWPNRRWRLLQEFTAVDFLEFGWGDERFYQAEENTVGVAVRAALWPTPSVIHVIGLASNGPTDAQANDIVPVRVSAEGLRALTAGIEREFAGEQPIPNGPEVSWAPAPNRFYDAKRTFYFPRMCNWWVAKRLEDAGCPIRPWTVVAARRVIREARRFSQ